VSALAEKLGPVLAVALASVACAPTPDDVRVRARSEVYGPLYADALTLAAGDLALLDTVPVDGGDPMDLCVDAISDAPDTVRVLRITGECRTFVVTGEKAGTATVRFTARGTTHAIRFDVSD
jgi:hypothetical protein